MQQTPMSSHKEHVMMITPPSLMEILNRNEFVVVGKPCMYFGLRKAGQVWSK